MGAEDCPAPPGAGAGTGTVVVGGGGVASVVGVGRDLGRAGGTTLTDTQENTQVVMRSK